MEGSPTTWNDYARVLGRNLQRRRAELGFTQEHVALQAAMTRTHYQQIERGFWKVDQSANPSLRVLVRIVQVLETDMDSLLPPIDRLEWEQPN